MAWSRRDFLKGLGLSAAALGLPGSRRALAGGGEIPLRILFVYESWGSFNGFWEPRPAPGQSVVTETQWQLGELLTPLNAYRDRMILMRGLDMVSARRDPTPGREAHLSARTHALTGAYRADSQTAGGISINQLIANRLNSPTPLTRLSSLEVGVRAWEQVNDGGTYSGPGSPVPFLLEPPAIYDRLFPPELRLGAEEAQREQRRRGAIFDLVRSRSDALIAELPSEQRTKVQQHLDTRADLERRLNLGVSRAGNIPPQEVVAPWAGVRYIYNNTPQERAQVWNAMAELNTQMVAAALHADITRVATLYIHRAPPHLWGYNPGAYGSTDAHDFSHRVAGDNPSLRDPSAVGLCRDMHLRCTEAIAHMLDQLASRTEPDGQSLLDHTLVVMCGEIANGSHEVTRLPWLLVGDACGQLRTGRCLTFDRRSTRTGRVVPIDQWADLDQEGRPHNDLHVSLANAMGIEIESFGEASVCTGPISELA